MTVDVRVQVRDPETRQALQGLKRYIDSYLPQSVFNATREPKNTDDITKGWSVGSAWIDITTDYNYRCSDNTRNAAVWSQSVDLLIGSTGGSGGSGGTGGIAGTPTTLGTILAEDTNGVWGRLAAGANNTILIPDSGEALGVKWVAGVGGIDTDAIHDNVAAEISAITEKTQPLSADFVVLEDSAASDTKKRAIIGNVPGAVVDASTPSAVIGKLWWDSASSPSAIGGVRTITTITSDYTASLTDDVILVDSTVNVTVTLPAAADRTGKQYDIKKINPSENTVTVDGNGTETIDDALTAVLTDEDEEITVVSDAVEWRIL